MRNKRSSKSRIPELRSLSREQERLLPASASLWCLTNLPRLRHHSHLCPSPQPISSLSVSPFLPPWTSLRWTLVIGSRTHSDNPGLSPPVNALNLNTSAKTSFEIRSHLEHGDTQIQWGLVQFSRSVASNSLRPHGLQHTRPPCPSPTPGVYSNLCPSSDAIQPFHLCCPLLLPPSILPRIRVFSSQFFTSGGQVLEFQL